jgi:hypothetical protein
MFPNPANSPTSGLIDIAASYDLLKENIYLRQENRQTHKKNTLLQAAKNQSLDQSLQERDFFATQ